MDNMHILDFFLHFFLPQNILLCGNVAGIFIFVIPNLKARALYFKMICDLHEGHFSSPWVRSFHLLQPLCFRRGCSGALVNGSLPLVVSDEKTAPGHLEGILHPTVLEPLRT